MCVRFCEFWTWRITSCAVAVVYMIVGFIYGPFHTIVYFTEAPPEIANLLQREAFLATFLWFLVGMMWYIFVSNIILLLACTRRSIILIDLYIIFTVFQLVVSFVFCVHYLFTCTVIDKYCFDHDTRRQSDDVGAAIGIVLADLLYIAIGAVVMFVVANYKLSLQLCVFN